MDIILDFVLHSYYNFFHNGIEESEVEDQKKKVRKALLLIMYIIILFTVGYLLFRFQ